ncbi:MAG TPA: hypothetical protein VHS33_02510 [Sphingomicrobium sp.]|jgi:hypothetical protein|nr:hypothetical protein [Sphingomicrobium sp.]
MHFHLPKPLHGWREFAGEVGIIVLGVLIALGAEQFVESAHQRLEGVQAEGTIRNEIALNLGRLQSRSGIHSCIDRRIEDLQKLLDGAASDPNIVTPSWIGRPQYWTFLDSRWQAESQAGRAALVGARRLSDYGIMYNRMQNLQEEMAIEQTDWAKLRTLEHLRRLDSAGALEFNVTLQDARYRDWRLALVTDQLFGMAKALQLRAMVNTTSADRSICLPITTTRAEANRLSVWAVGEP